MSNFLKNKLLLFAIVLGAVLRLWSLGSNPPHLFSDEAALGYNAYSILKTARDEHGEFLPIIFKSFGDWKPGLYVYLTVPFVWAFGLTEWSVRLPGALAGIMAVWLIYLLTDQLFKNLKIENFKLKIMASFLLAISPWHIHFSRGAWEANVALTLLLGGIYLFLKFAENQDKRSLFLSVILLGLTFWTYQGAKLSTSIVVLILAALHAGTLLKTKKKLLLKAGALGVLIVAPIFLSFWQGKTGRLEVFSVFSYRRPEAAVQEILTQENVNKNSQAYYLYHSEPISLIRGILGRWTNHYSGRFLFFEGDWNNPRHEASSTGMLLLIQAPLLALGFIQLFKTPGKAKWLVLAWLVASPLPAALSRDSVHAIRSYHLVVPATILTALGVAYLTELLRKNKLRAMWFTAFLIVTLLNYVYYLDQYYVHYPKHDSKAWLYGYKEAVEEVTRDWNSYDQIIFQQSYNQPYIFFLFHQRYDPGKYQEISKAAFEDSQYGDVGKVTSLEKISFRDATEGDLHKPKTMIVYDPETPPFPAILQNQPDAEVKDINRLNGTTAFRILRF